MANELKINLIVNDDGTATIKSFSDNASANLRKVTDAGSNMKTGFAQTWQGMATGINQASQLIQQLVGFVQPMIQAFMASEQATQKLGIALLNQGEYSREALGDMEEFAEQMQKTTTVEDDLAKSVMGGLKSFGMTTDEVKRATRASADMAAFTGKSIETVADLLGKAYAGNTAALSRYGIVVDESVPKAEKFTAVMAQLEQRFGGAAQAELLTYAGQWKQLQNQWGDVQEFLGLVFLKTIQAMEVAVGLVGVAFLSVGSKILQSLDIIMTPLKGILMLVGLVADAVGADGLATAMELAANSISDARANILATKDATMEWTSKQYENLKATDNVTTSLDKMGNKTKETIAIDEDAAKAAKKAAEEREKTIKKITDELTKFAENADNINKSQYEKDIEWLNKQVKAYEDAGGNKAAIAQLIADAMTKIDAKAFEEMAKNARKAEEEAVKSWEAEIAVGVKASEDAIKRMKDRGEAERKIYEDIRGYEQQAYDASIKLIADQAENYRQLGVDEVAVTAWVTEETRKAYLKKAEYSGSFMEGVKAGLDDMASKTKSWGSVGVETVKSFSSNASSTMGSVFFDAYKGQLKSSTEYFTAFSDALVKTFTDALAKMIVEAALSKITMSFNATWTEGAGAVLGAVGKVLGYAADWFFSSDYAESMVPLAYGGLINGLNPGADSYAYDTIPAMLSPGEYVMPRSAVNQETVGALEYMRQTGQKPMGYADGGLVASPEEQSAFALYLERQRSGQSVSYLELLNHGVADQWWLGDNSGTNYFYVPPDMIASLEQGRSRQLAVFEQLMAEHALLQADLQTFLHNAYSDPSYLYKTTADTWKKFAGLSLLGNPISGTLESPDSMPIVLGYQNNIPVYSGYPWGHLGDYYTVDNSGNLTYGYGSSGKGKFGLNDFIGMATMAVGAAAATYVTGGLGAALGAELLGSSAIGGAIGGALGAGTLNAAQQSAGGEEFNWASLGLSSAGGAVGGYLIGSSDLFTAGGQAARELSANTIGNAAYHDALATGLSREAAEIAYINAYNASLANATAEIIQDMGISALTSVGKKYAISWLLGLVMGKPQSGTLGIGFEGISGGAGLADMLKNFPSSVNGDFAFPARSGIDYVPRDNFLINAHEGEAVLTKEENFSRKGGRYINITFNLYATVADQKTMNNFAEQIYPRLEKLRAWGH